MHPDPIIPLLDIGGVAGITIWRQNEVYTLERKMRKSGTA